MYIINESPILANIFKSKCRLIDIDVFSTKGLIYYYKVNNKKISVFPRENSINTINFLKNLAKNGEEVVIASDYDSTGELIALEILNLIPGAKRLKVPFDELLKHNSLNPEKVRRYVDNKFNIEMATLYIREITRDIDIYKKRNNIFAEIVQNNIESIIIPKNIEEEFYEEEEEE